MAPKPHSSGKSSVNSSDTEDDYGNSYFAVSGVPVPITTSGIMPPRNLKETSSIAAAKISAALSNRTQLLNTSPGPGHQKYGIPVIVTQPTSITGSPKPIHSRSGSAPAAPGGFMSRSFDGDLPGVEGVRLVDPRRALSPQPVSDRSWADMPDPRRALSPGPDLLRSEFTRRSLNYSRPQTGRQTALPSRSVMNNSSGGQGKFPVALLVNPTKLPTFTANGNSMEGQS